MTFCLGMIVDEGIVGIADTRLTSGNEIISAKKVSLYQQGLGTFFIMTSGLRSLRDKTLTYFQEAIAQDPNYAAAYAGMADCYLLLQWRGGMPSLEALARARETGLKALALDPSLAEAHATLAQVSISANWDWKGAEDEFKRAIELNPNYATAHHWYGLSLGQQGRAQEAQRELERARELDPLPPINQANVAWAYYVARDYDRAIALLRDIVKRNPDFWVARWGLGSAYVQKGQFTDAIRELEKAMQLSQADPGTISSLAYAQARAGDRARAESWLQQLQARAQHGQTVSPGDIALVYTGLGERKPALEWLEKAYSEHSHDLLTLKSDPWWDSLRDEAQFQQLLSKIGLGNS